MTSYVKTRHLSQKRNSIRNVLKPTRSFGHFRFKSYGPLSDFHKSDDLDLAFYPIFKKKVAHSPWSRRHLLSKFQDDRTSGVVCTSLKDRQTDKQTNKQTNRQTAVTNILCENRRFRKVTNTQTNRHGHYNTSPSPYGGRGNKNWCKSLHLGVSHHPVSATISFMGLRETKTCLVSFV